MENTSAPSKKDQPVVAVEERLRPQTLADYVGQTKVKESLQVFIEAAKKRGDPLPHLLIHGGPGLGKTTLARIIAHELGVGFRQTSGPALERTGDLAAIISSLNDRDVLFVDEIHRLSRVVEEMLYPAMESYAIDLVLGKGLGAKTMRLDMPRFTLVGATTRFGALSAPLRERFGLVHHLNFYEIEEIATIITRSAKILDVAIDRAATALIAARARRTPRVANRLVARLRDFAQVKGSGKIDEAIAQTALDAMEIDDKGLDAVDRRVLKTIVEKFNGGPVGITTIAAACREERETIEEVIEPYLLQIGFLDRTAQGRKVTPLAYSHLGIQATML
ncbi:Holliday junction branch migration DNA helicase RuvB [Candidatus Berkelbacteria bacterium]|nr:Holliday junction branch migration DNA helicase RuvB [Candidatus Berkelbacteria bacterium]